MAERTQFVVCFRRRSILGQLCWGVLYMPYMHTIGVKTNKGAYYYCLNLFPRYGLGPIADIADWLDYAMTDVKMNTSNGIIDPLLELSIQSIVFYSGPYFETKGIESIITITSFCYNDMTAMIDFEYENERVFLAGPHPD
jgi:hypothetical protein